MLDHKTVASHGPARIAMQIKVYQLLVDYVRDKEPSDLIFTTSTGTTCSYNSLEKLQSCTPYNRINKGAINSNLPHTSLPHTSGLKSIGLNDGGQGYLS